MPTPVATAPISKTLSSLFASLLMAALRVWPRLAASASTPLTITEALALEEQFRHVVQALRLGKSPGALAKSPPLRGRAGCFLFLAGWTARRAPTTGARQGRALHASLIPHRPLPWASACSSPSRGTTGACLPGSPLRTRSPSFWAMPASMLSPLATRAGGQGCSPARRASAGSA